MGALCISTMIPANYDTVTRTLTRLSLLSPDENYLDGKPIIPILTSKVILSDSLFREFVCVKGCKACCGMAHTLDYLPTSPMIEKIGRDLFIERQVSVNGTSRPVMTIPVETKLKGGEGLGCIFLGATTRDGSPGCKLWPDDPLECIASLLLQFRGNGKPGEVLLNKSGFGRAWKFKERPQCEFNPVPLERMGLDYLIHVLDVYHEWADYFGIVTVIRDIQSIIRQILEREIKPVRQEYIIRPRLVEVES